MDDTQIRNPVIKNIVLALSVMFLGLMLLIFAYLLDNLFQSSFIYFAKTIFHYDLALQILWFPQAMHILFIFIITYISILILGSGLPTSYKASYSMVPFALIYVTFAVFYYPWPNFVYFISFMFYVSVFYFFYKVNVHWLYYYSFTLVSLGLYIVSVTGSQI